MKQGQLYNGYKIGPTRSIPLGYIASAQDERTGVSLQVFGSTVNSAYYELRKEIQTRTYEELCYERAKQKVINAQVSIEIVSTKEIDSRPAAGLNPEAATSTISALSSAKKTNDIPITTHEFPWKGILVAFLLILIAWKVYANFFSNCSDAFASGWSSCNDAYSGKCRYLSNRYRPVMCFAGGHWVSGRENLLP